MRELFQNTRLTDSDTELVKMFPKDDAEVWGGRYVEIELSPSLRLP